MKSERLNVLNERDLIYQLIVSDKFCREIVPILNPKHLQIEYAKRIALWIKDYFTKFKKAPKKDIIKLYRSHVEEINDESLQDNILSFLQRLDEDYDEVKLGNVDFAIQQAVNYLKIQSMRNFSEDIEAYLDSGDVGKAESLLTKYRKVEVSSGEGVSILDDFDTVTEAFTEETEKLFSMQGAYGQLMGDVHREDFISFLAPMKVGKCLAKGTKILMADGSIKEVQNLKVGDKLMGDDSKPRNVEIVSKGFGKMYRITSNVNPLRKNRQPEIDFTCNGNHILVLKNVWNAEKHEIKEYRKDGHKNGELLKNGKNNILKKDEIEISVEDFLKLSEYQKSHFKLFRSKVDYSEKNHLISPYLFGVWLGDGYSTASVIINMNDEVIQSCMDESVKIGDKLRIKPDKPESKVKNLRFYADVGSSNFKKELNRLNLLNNKHIPDEYMIDSRENRLNLLAGIIDTDGCYFSGKFCEINLMNKTLAKDVEKLCQQLGFRVKFNEKYKHYKNMYSETNGWAYSWSVSITGKLSEIPTRVGYKRMKDSKKYNSLNNTFSFSIESLKDDDYYGFVIDGNHRFLLADTTVSHNTFSLIDVGIEALKNGLKVVFYSLEMSRTNMIKRIWKALSGQVTEDMEIEIPYFEKDEDEEKYRIEKKIVQKQASSVLEVQKKQQSLKRLFRGGSFKVFAEPAYSLTVEKLEDKLDDLAYDNFFPDVIIVDYADIMCPSDKTDYRNQIDGIWKRLRALAQKRKAVVFTASQTNREAISKEVEADSVAEDIRKLAHVTSMVSISKTKWCKENSLAIFSQLAVRDGKPVLRKVIATQCLELGRPCLESRWKDEVVIEDEEKDTRRKKRR